MGFVNVSTVDDPWFTLPDFTCRRETAGVTLTTVTVTGSVTVVLFDVSRITAVITCEPFEAWVVFHA